MAIVTTTGSLSTTTLPALGTITGGAYNGTPTMATIGTVNFDNGNNYTFTGTFTFDAVTGDLTGGLLDNVTIAQNGTVVTTIASINTNPADTQNFVDSGNQVGFIGFFLAGDDSITGSDGANIIDGFNGNDTLTAGNGADSIDGGLGNDLIFGGTGLVSANDGADVIIGGVGLDSLYGNAGGDTIFGGTGIFSPTDASDEFLHGGKGDDQLYGNGGNDTLFGGEGVDTAFGGEGNDILYGGWQIFDPTDTTDSLVGGNGDDTIYGNGGDDTLLGGSGNDSLHGGDGNDTYIFDFSTTGTDNVLAFDNAGAVAGDVLAFTDSTNMLGTTAANILSLITYADGNAMIDFSAAGSNLDVTITGVAANSITIDDITVI